MAKTARAVQVPGEPTQELPATEPPQELQAAVAEGEAGQPLADEVAALRAQLEAERLARIEAEQRAAAVAAESVAAKRPAAVVKTSAGHPTPQLTEGGWVVPQSFGAPVVKG